MPWLLLLVVALLFTTLGKALRLADEVYVIAIFSTGILSACWGFITAPSTVQLGLGMVALGWLQVSSRLT
ncbi:MAG: hypothetical protein AAF215_20225 [Cyanobacteria bacterium P01_A01_bin.123]